jgi:hypothetical protein
LALGRNSEEYHTEKVVVITGPTLGSSLKLILIGALMGSLGTFYWLRQQEEDDSDAGRKEKARQLLHRASNLARRTKDLAQTVTQSLMPQWQAALETAKSTAAETEHELHKEIENES